MRNYLTGYEYSGSNIDALCAAGYDEGDEFVTFKQALKLKGVTGKKLKGIKKAATLMGLKKKEDEETGKIVKVPFYFAVFNVQDVFARVK